MRPFSKIDYAAMLLRHAWETLRNEGPRILIEKVNHYFRERRRVISLEQGSETPIRAVEAGVSRRSDPGTYTVQQGLVVINYREPCFIYRARKYHHLPQERLLSVICMPSSREILSFLVAGALEQSYKNWELIVSPCGKWDLSEDLAGQPEDSRILLLSKAGMEEDVDPFNKAVRAASGEYFAYMVEGDLYDRDLFLVLVNELNQGPSLEAVYCVRQPEKLLMSVHRPSPLYANSKREV